MELDLDQARRRAKELLRAARAGDPNALTWRGACPVASVEGARNLRMFLCVGAPGAGTGEGSASSSSESG